MISVVPWHSLKSDRDDLIVIKHPSKVIDVRCVVGVGSSNDPPNAPGLAHFLEHMIMKGPRHLGTEEAFDEATADLGDTDGITDTDNTIFYIRCMVEDLHKAIDLLVATIYTPRLSGEDFAKESTPIETEIADNEAGPIVQWIFHGAAQACPARMRAPWGKPLCDAPGISRESIIQFYVAHYHNLQFVITGDVPLETTRWFNESIETYYPQSMLFPHRKLMGNTAEGPISRPNPPFDIRDIHLVWGTQDLACVGYVFPTATGQELAKEASIALDIIEVALTGGAGSILFSDLRRERSLCYQVGSQFWVESDFGMGMVYALTPPENAHKVREVMLARLQEIRDNGLTDDMLTRVKKQLRMLHNAELDASHSTADMFTFGLNTYGYSTMILRLLKHDTLLQVESNSMIRRALQPATFKYVELIPEDVL